MPGQLLPESFKAAQVKTAGSDLELVDVPLALPKSAGDVLVKVLACGVCQGDTIPTAGHVPLPRIPGHEIVGDVVAVHESETMVSFGRVVMKKLLVHARDLSTTTTVESR
jgi:D-arabinose 1-dehydrogenase-like Zn-dependent alcohol dehydrogenase